VKKELIGSGFLLIVAYLYYRATVSIPISLLADEVGPHGLPTLLALGLAAVSLAIGIRAIVLRPTGAAMVVEANAGGTPKPDQEASPLRALGLLVIAALYMPLAWLFGYAPALALLIVAVAIYEGMRLSWQLVAVALAGTALFWLLFVTILRVSQPVGIIF
jgi:hypothetical protein